MYRSLNENCLISTITKKKLLSGVKNKVLRGTELQL